MGLTALCPGTFDPVTNGHLDIIGRAARVFDKVVVGVVNQPIRKEKTLFTADERRDFIHDATTDLENVEVEVFSRASTPTNDRRTMLQLLVFVGLLGGLAAGAALALLRASREVRRRPV